MGFYREFKNMYLQQVDRISFDTNIKNSVGYRAFLRSEKNITKDDHSLDGETCGVLAGIFTDVLSLLILPIGLYAYQKIKKSNPQML
ncbi:MAG: hypothetical protein WA139_05150 [Candidatus Aenigmatarchaeota archaeon]